VGPDDQDGGSNDGSNSGQSEQVRSPALHDCFDLVFVRVGLARSSRIRCASRRIVSAVAMMDRSPVGRQRRQMVAVCEVDFLEDGRREAQGMLRLRP